MLEYIVMAGGFYHILLGGLHVSFWRWKRLAWEEELPQMSTRNRPVIQLMNIACIVYFFLVAYISLFCAGEMLSTVLGRTLLWGISLFWLIRLVGQFIFFNYREKMPVDWALVAVLSIGFCLYAYPLWMIRG